MTSAPNMLHLDLLDLHTLYLAVVDPKILSFTLLSFAAPAGPGDKADQVQV